MISHNFSDYLYPVKTTIINLDKSDSIEPRLLSARRVDKFSNSVLNYVPQFSFAKEQQQLDDGVVDETT
jgi:hypothetical protein